MSCLGLKPSVIKEKGMRYFWSRIHPDDLEYWIIALAELMNFTLKEISIEDRKLMTYTWNYRFKNAKGVYVNILQNTTPLEFDKDIKLNIIEPNITWRN